MHGDVFAKVVVITDDEGSGFAVEFKVLWYLSEADVMADSVVFTDVGVVFDDTVRPDVGALPDGDVGSDDTEWANRDVVANFSFRIDHSGWVYVSHYESTASLVCERLILFRIDKHEFDFGFGCEVPADVSITLCVSGTRADAYGVCFDDELVAGCDGSSKFDFVH